MFYIKTKLRDSNIMLYMTVTTVIKYNKSDSCYNSIIYNIEKNIKDSKINNIIQHSYHILI